MNGKEKFLFAAVLIFSIVSVYFWELSGQLNERMDQLNLADKNHVDKVLGAYSDSLHTYNLRFIGRGKHLRTAQNDIITNTDMIERNTDSLASLIDDVSFRLDNFTRETQKNFRNINNDLDDLATEMKGSVRKLKQGISTLDQTTKALQKRLKEIEDLALIQKEKAKAAEKD
tara:strand:- start:43 stop:558 length:516 start_codon:yes stop_codon:yes gene_type:complete